MSRHTPAHAPAQQQRTALDEHPAAPLAAVAEGVIGRRDAPGRIMRRRRHHRDRMARSGEEFADLAGAAADAGDLRRVVHRIDQDARHCRLPTSLTSSDASFASRRMCEIPGVGVGDPRFEADARPPAQRRKPRAAHQLARRPVRLARIDRDRPAVADRLGDELGELADRQVLARADVDRRRRGIDLQHERQRVGAVVDMEKLATRRAAAPDRHRRQAPALGVVRLADQRRQHVTGVRIEVVAGAVKIARHRRNVVAADIAGDRLGRA